MKDTIFGRQVEAWTFVFRRGPRGYGRAAWIAHNLSGLMDVMKSEGEAGMVAWMRELRRYESTGGW